MVNGALSSDVTTFAVDTPTQSGFLEPAPGASHLAISPESGYIGEFLSRPVQIATYTWTSAAPINTHIDPWVLFLSDTFVREKIARFSRLRANLNIEIQVNGTPFHYGMILASYEPANGIRQSIDGDYRQHSNLQHGFINPTNSASVSLVGPFIKPDFWIDLQDALSPAIGVLNLDTVVGLQSASGTVDPVTINVYAWMTDVELAFPTSLSLATFTPQAKKVMKKKRKMGTQVGKDEYEVVPNSGMISGPASAVANIASKLTSVPIIGQFATATEIAANSVSSIAKLFGYSRPKALTAPASFLALPGSIFAATDQVVNAIPATFDSKAEISIDPTIVGLASSEDELAISAIARKPTLMRVDTWTMADLVGETISVAPVQPNTWSINAAGAGVDLGRLEMSALAFTCIPFEYWSGTLVFRFQIVCSKFHRGRLRFNYSSSPAFAGTDELNTSYNHIVDISPGKEFEIHIPWSQEQPMLPIEDIGNVIGVPSNGFLNVRVQNELVAPDSTSPVSLMCWIYAGDDFTVSVPTGLRYQGMVLTPQSAHEEGDAEVECEVIHFFEGKQHEHFEKVFIGDPVRSFRNLLKRYTMLNSFSDGLNVLVPAQSIRRRMLQIPMYPQRNGVVVNATGKAIDNSVGNINYTHLAAFLEPSFLAKKGGFRWYFDDSAAILKLSTDSLTIGPPVVTRMRSDDVRQYQTFDQKALTSTNSGANSGRTLFTGNRYDTFAGTQVYLGGGRMPEIELPYYTPFKYSTTFGCDDSPYYPRESALYYRTVATYSTSDVGSRLGHPIDVYGAAAEDFTMHVFLGVPRWQYRDSGEPDFGISYTAWAGARTDSFPGY